MGGHVVEDDVQHARGIFYRELPEVGAKMRRVNFWREEEVPEVPGHVERAIDVHLFAASLHLHHGLLPAPPPHARDRGAPLEGAGIDKEEVIRRPRALDAGAQVVKECLLLLGISPGGHRPGPERGEALAAEDPHEGAGGEKLAKPHLDVVASQLPRPVREGVPQLAGGREDRLPHLLLLGGGQGGRAAGVFFPKRPSRPRALNASTQRRIVSASTRQSSATRSAFPSWRMRRMTCRRRTRLPFLSFLNNLVSVASSGSGRVTVTLGGRLIPTAKKSRDLRLMGILSRQ